MTKIEKLIDRFISKPNDFTWGELQKLMAAFGYKEVSGGKTGGSRIRFIHTDYSPVILHKPHPAKILKRYQIEGILQQLRQEDLL